MPSLRQAASVLSLLLLVSCGTKTYEPQEFSLRDKSIRDFEVSGEIEVSSINMQENPKVIYKNLTKFESSYRDISNLMAAQIAKEIRENSTVDGNADKKLYIQLDRFYIEPGTAAINFHMDFTLLGERGFEKHFQFESQGERLSQKGIEVAFDNAIALSVKKVLYNGETLRYLAAKDLKTL